MYRLRERRRASARRAAFRNRWINKSLPAAGPSQDVEASLAQPKYHLDYAKWYAALAGHNDGRPRDRAAGAVTMAAPSNDLRDLLLSGVKAA